MEKFILIISLDPSDKLYPHKELFIGKRYLQRKPWGYFFVDKMDEQLCSSIYGAHAALGVKFSEKGEFKSEILEMDFNSNAKKEFIHMLESLLQKLKYSKDPGNSYHFMELVTDFDRNRNNLRFKITDKNILGEIFGKIQNLISQI